MSKNVADFSQVFKEINKLGKNLEKAVVDAVNEGAEFAAAELAKDTPVDQSKYQDEVKAKDHVTYSKATRANLNAEVGYDKEVAWRMHFVEYGTIKQKPQGFVARTMKDIEAKLQKIIMDKLRGVIK